MERHGRKRHRNKGADATYLIYNVFYYMLHPPLFIAEIPKAHMLTIQMNKHVFNYLNVNLPSGDVIPIYDVSGHTCNHEIWKIFILNHKGNTGQKAG
jgi:hypothetical protein